MRGNAPEVVTSSTPRRVRAELEKASKAAWETLKAEGHSSAKVASITGLSEAVVRRLGADGDQAGWRVPTPRTCALIDDYCLTRLQRSFGLARLRAELGAAQGLAAESHVRDKQTSTLRAYLSALGQTLSATPAWVPFKTLDDGFQQRSVSVTHTDPTSAAARAGPVRVHRGDVPWVNAVTATGVAVVIGDAGYGKSWQSRQHAAQLAIEALAEDDPVNAPLPLWMHAADLAAVWPGGSPMSAVVDAAALALRRRGIDTRDMQDAVELALADPQTPVTFVVDAYDELTGSLRPAAREALAWLAESCRQHDGSARQLVITSRPAGWDDPVGISGSSGADAVYLYLGALNESQVRRLWTHWYRRRNEPVPDERLAHVLAPGATLRQFVRVPLIAAFCAWVAETDAVAASRTALFGQVVDRFMSRAWKSQDRPVDQAGDDDGARRVELAAALAEFAFSTATADEWTDSVDPAECESILRRRGPAPMPGRSLTFEAVRLVGILTQPSARGGVPLGDGPVTWIHRSVQEYLAATHLSTRAPDAVSEVVRRAWHDPALGGVLDFAVALNDGGDRVPKPDAVSVRAEVERLVDAELDPLGYYTAVLAGAGTVRRRDIDRAWLLHEAGLLSASILSRTLAATGTTEDWQHLVERLLALRAGAGRVNGADIHETLAWCGPPGRAALARLISTDPAATGASLPLYNVDPTAAVVALEQRVAARLSISSADAPCMREVGEATVAMLAEALRGDPGDGGVARTLAYTRHPAALPVLERGLRSSDARVRHASAHGLSTWYGNAIDPPGFALLVNVALHDRDANVRLAVRGALTAVGLSVPWVERAIDDQFEALHEDDGYPPLRDLASLAARLWPVGPATHKVIAMLQTETRLIRGEVVAQLESLARAALQGDLDLPLTADIARLLGDDFRDAATTVLTAGVLTGDKAANLATALGLAASDDPAVFDLVVAAAMRHPSLLLEAAIATFDLPVQDRVLGLAMPLDAAQTVDRVAAEMCVDAIRRVLQTAAPAERDAVRPVCLAITAKLLAMSSG